MNTDTIKNSLKSKNARIAGVAAIAAAVIALAIGASMGEKAEAPVTDMSTTTVVAKLTAATWVWTGTLMNDGSSTTPRQADSFSLTFAEDGRVSGTTDCNAFAGSYSVKDGGLISFSPFAMTKKFCQDSQEMAFVGAIAQASSTFFTEAGDLVLELAMDSGGVSFRQKASPAIPAVKAPAEPTGFVNLSYRLIGYRNTSVPVGSQYTLTFSGANGISAKFCNTMSGTYTESKGKIKAESLVSTLMFCAEPAGLMDIETAFGVALAEGVTPVVQGKYLALIDKDWNRFTFELVR